MGFKWISAFIALFLAVLSTHANAQHIYTTDRGHTEVLFSWSHAGVSLQNAEFANAEGTLTLYPDRIEDSHLEATIDATSISSGYGPMDEMFRSRRLFHVDEYPEITFKSTSIELTGEDTALVTGDLTVRGVTKPLVLDTKLTFKGGHPLARNLPTQYKGEWLAFRATGKIKNHTAFNVGNSYTFGSRWWVSIVINTELQRQYD